MHSIVLIFWCKHLIHVLPKYMFEHDKQTMRMMPVFWGAESRFRFLELDAQFSCNGQNNMLNSKKIVDKIIFLTINIAKSLPGGTRMTPKMNLRVAIL